MSIYTAFNVTLTHFATVLSGELALLSMVEIGKTFSFKLQITLYNRPLFQNNGGVLSAASSHVHTRWDDQDVKGGGIHHMRTCPTRQHINLNPNEAKLLQSQFTEDGIHI